ncbi:MAG: isochorismatase family protein [Polyangiaceae bacterium]
MSRAETLRSLYGLANASLEPANTALVLIDLQRELVEGRLRVDGAARAIGRAAALRDAADEAGVLVVAVQNVAARADSPLFAESDPHTRFVEALVPRAIDLQITKRMAGAFTAADLHDRLRARGITDLVLAGFMTHLAVDCTARDATVLGYRVVIAADACATRDLPARDGAVVRAHDLHRAALAALADRFAWVTDADAIVERWATQLRGRRASP